MHVRKEVVSYVQPRIPKIRFSFNSRCYHTLLDMFDKAVIAELARRQGVDHRLSYVPATYRQMDFATSTWAELVALMNHRLAAAASQSAFQLIKVSSQQHRQSLVQDLHRGEMTRLITVTPPSVALHDKLELPIKHDDKYKESPTCNSGHYMLSDALATKETLTKQVGIGISSPFSFLDLKTINGAERSRMNTNHVLLHYPSPKFSGSALLKWAQSIDLQEREASNTSTDNSIGVLECLSKDNVASAPAQAFKRSISRTNNAKKTKKLPLKKRAMRRLRPNTVESLKKITANHNVKNHIPGDC